MILNAIELGYGAATLGVAALAVWAEHTSRECKGVAFCAALLVAGYVPTAFLANHVSIETQLRVLTAADALAGFLMLGEWKARRQRWALMVTMLLWGQSFLHVVYLAQPNYREWRVLHSYEIVRNALFAAQLAVVAGVGAGPIAARLGRAVFPSPQRFHGFGASASRKRG